MTTDAPGGMMTSNPEAIGRYRVLSTLGVGGFATVYLAEDPKFEAHVAVKVMAATVAADIGLRERFIQEARVMRRLAAPGLVTVYDISEHEGLPYFVMEHCARGTLADRLTTLGRSLTFGEGLGLIAALAESTSGIHNAGIVHRDLKPSNYLIRHAETREADPIGDLLRPDEELVVADFGLAKWINRSATQLSIAGGTPGFSSPEQFRGDPSVDGRCDIYALSAITVSALTNTQPLPALIETSKPFDEETLGATGVLSRELKRGLSYHPNQRHADVAEWSAALIAAAGEHVAGTGASPARVDTQILREREPASRYAPAAPQRRPKRLLRWIGVATAVLLLLTGGAAVSRGTLRLPGGQISGPATAHVGEQATYVYDGENVTWSANGTSSIERTMTIEPRQTGPFEITAESGIWTTSMTVIVSEPSPTLRIVGDSFVRTGETVTFEAVGSDAVEFTWTVKGIDGQIIGTSNAPTITVTGADLGLVSIELESDAGDRTERTINIIDVAE